ncbi:acyl-CoA thioesterase domain-containing protein [Mycobacterium intracellulare]|nr:acyl-CoA thioesterase domain-containing protein [Mycobacterium intracellulare]MEE3751428.1 acyl-CoA thioesterase domain-containing protein [Mycobacterium intracellulare]
MRLLDVTLDADGSALGDTGALDTGGRRVVEGAQIVGQAIVAVAKRLPDKTIRSAQAVFSRVVTVGEPVRLHIDVVSDGTTTGTAVVTASQNGRRCMVITILADTPARDLIRHQIRCPTVAPPGRSSVCPMPMKGRQVRLVGIDDAFDPWEVGPPEIRAWVCYDEAPHRDELRKALIANFTGYLGIATSMRPHPGVGMSQAHTTLSTAPMTTAIVFHEPVRCDGWNLYSHESTYAGAGMSYVRGTVHTDENHLIASFSQEALIRPVRTNGSGATSNSRL